MEKQIVMVDGYEIPVFEVTNDLYGNRRYVVHYRDIGLHEYESTQRTRKAGIKKYRGMSFGGGFVFQSSNPSITLKRVIGILHKE